MNSTTKLPLNPNVIKECDICKVPSVHRKRIVILDKQYSICTDCEKMRKENQFYAERSTVSNNNLTIAPPKHAAIAFTLSGTDSMNANIAGKELSSEVVAAIDSFPGKYKLRYNTEEYPIQRVNQTLGENGRVSLGLGGDVAELPHYLFDMPWRIADERGYTIFTSIIEEE